MKKGLIVSLLSVAVLFSPVVFAYDKGDTAYLCNKRQKFLWVLGADRWDACPVRILEKAGGGGSYRVLGIEYCLVNNGWDDSVERGGERWLGSGLLWSSRSSCENQ